VPTSRPSWAASRRVLGVRAGRLLEIGGYGRRQAVAVPESDAAGVPPGTWPRRVRSGVPPVAISSSAATSCAAPVPTTASRWSSRDRLRVAVRIRSPISPGAARANRLGHEAGGGPQRGGRGGGDGQHVRPCRAPAGPVSAAGRRRLFHEHVRVALPLNRRHYTRPVAGDRSRASPGGGWQGDRQPRPVDARGGVVTRCRGSRHGGREDDLSRPAAPAAAPRCPMLALTEPMSTLSAGCAVGAERVGERSAPRWGRRAGLPVPCAST